MVIHLSNWEKRVIILHLFTEKRLVRATELGAYTRIAIMLVNWSD